MSGFLRPSHDTSMLTPLLVAGILLLGGCASAPTMHDVEVVSQDTRLVYGSAEIYVDDERQKLGFSWTAESHFFLIILPPDSNEAISYDLDDSGQFFWALAPGEYNLLGYHWQKGTERRSGTIGATFVVPEGKADHYIGSMEFRGNQIFLDMYLLDKFDEFSALYDKKFPDRMGTSVSQLMKMPEKIGHFAAIAGPCNKIWGIQCGDRYAGVTPSSPETGTSGFPTIGTRQPEFRWQPSSLPEVSYDLILYEAASYTTSGVTTEYTQGRLVAYMEDLKNPGWQPETPLKPNTRYFWSVRFRLAEEDTVSRWSTQSHSMFLLLAWSSGYGQWFQFKTP
jgi:hypothetical protein